MKYRTIVADSRLMVWQARERFPAVAFLRFRTGLVHAVEARYAPTLLARTACGRSGWIDSASITADHKQAVLVEDEQVCMQCVSALARFASPSPKATEQ